MSTTGGTEQGTVYVLDEPDVVRKKFKRAQTDSGREIVRAPDKPGITNLIEILAVARGCDPAEIEARVRRQGLRRPQDDGRRRGRRLADAVRERYHELRSDEAALEARLAEGAERARAIAAPVVADVRDAMGVGPARRSVGPAA